MPVASAALRAAFQAMRVRGLDDCARSMSSAKVYSWLGSMALSCGTAPAGRWPAARSARRGCRAGPGRRRCAAGVDGWRPGPVGARWGQVQRRGGAAGQAQQGRPGQARQQDWPGWADGQARHLRQGHGPGLPGWFGGRTATARPGVHQLKAGSAASPAWSAGGDGGLARPRRRSAPAAASARGRPGPARPWRTAPPVSRRASRQACGGRSHAGS